MSHLAPSDAAMSPVAPATVHLRRRGRGSWHSAGVCTVQVLVFLVLCLRLGVYHPVDSAK